MFSISGGKDSCYNMMQCVEHGHIIVALANLKPTDEGTFEGPKGGLLGPGYKGTFHLLLPSPPPPPPPLWKGQIPTPQFFAVDTFEDCILGGQNFVGFEEIFRQLLYVTETTTHRGSSENFWNVPFYVLGFC